jgi:tetratricopeptide (TPR) repeat protein
MIKQVFSLVLVVCCWVFAFAQKPSADPNKVLAEAQRKMDSIMHDPKFKQWTNKNGQAGAASGTPGTPGSVGTPGLPANIAHLSANPSALLANAGAGKPDTAFLSGIKMPTRNEKGLASIPAQPMNRTQVVTFIRKMKSTIFAAMPGVIGRGPLTMTGYSDEGLDKGGVLAWCSGNTDLALELALDAADANPDNDNILDNLSAILTMCGLPYEAVPILDYLRQHDPGNTTINNNLGQAYYALGDAQKAVMYLKAAVGGFADHPQANFALACMAYMQGNKNSAIDYCEHSIRGAFSVNSWTMLKACKPDARLMDLIRHRYKQKDYFSPGKYPLLPQARKVADVRPLFVQYTEYKNMLIATKKRFQLIVKTEGDYVRKNLAADMMAKMQQRKNPLRPYSVLAQTVIGDITENLGDRMKKLDDFDSNYFHKMAELKKQHDDQCAQVEKKFAKRGDAAGEGNPDTELETDECKALNAVHNIFLPQMAELTEEWQRRWINETKNYYADNAYWCYLASTDDHSYRQMFYTNAMDWIDRILTLNRTQFLTCHIPATYSNKESDSLEIAEGKCPLTAKIDVSLQEEGKKPENFASFDITCEEYKVAFSLPEGAKLSVKQKAAGGTTVAFDMGLSAKTKKVAQIGVGASMGNFVSFGGSQPVDIGWRWEAEVTLPGYLGGKNSAGWSFGLNSELEFHGKGILVDAASDWADRNLFGVDPPDKQLNKNIKMFNVKSKSH